MTSVAGTSCRNDWTAVRGTSTWLRIRSAASKAPVTTDRCSGVTAGSLTSRSRSSSRVMTGRACVGSPPSNRTAALVERSRSQTAGRATAASMISGRAASTAQRSGRCIARRFGVSSPTTRVT